MKVIVVLLCVFAVIFIPTAAGRYHDGYYFSFRQIISHYVDDFPAFPDFGNSNFLEVATGLLGWIFAFIPWLIAPDPWVKGTPTYRTGVPWVL